MADLVLLERDGDIARVILNRPERLNAFNLAMWQRLGAVLASLKDDAGLHCVVLSGGESKAFGAGADIAEFPQVRASADQAEAYARSMAPSRSSSTRSAMGTTALKRQVDGSDVWATGPRTRVLVHFLTGCLLPAFFGTRCLGRVFLFACFRHDLLLLVFPEAMCHLRRRRGKCASAQEQ